MYQVVQSNSPLAKSQEVYIAELTKMSKSNFSLLDIGNCHLNELTDGESV